MGTFDGIGVFDGRIAGNGLKMHDSRENQCQGGGMEPKAAFHVVTGKDIHDTVGDKSEQTGARIPHTIMDGSMSETPSLISCHELAERLGEPDLVCLEAGFLLPGMSNGPEEALGQRIPGARYFDIEDIADPYADSPHMVPCEEDFTRKVQALGVNNDSLVVCYDRLGLFSAGRVWWMFRLFGHKRVAILDGGIIHWLQCGLPLEVMEETPITPGDFVARYDSNYYAHKADVSVAIAEGTTIVDARPEKRFAGSMPEPREGVRAGHMPGAWNLPFSSLVDPLTKKVRSPEELRALYANIPDNPRTIYTCGSGITAAALLFCAEQIGRSGRVYDGSWAEWGADPSADIVRSE